MSPASSGLTVASSSPPPGPGQVACPACGVTSSARHSRYAHHLQDLPAQGMRVAIRPSVARLQCRNGDCPRQIFAEPLPEVVPPLARRSASAGRHHPPPWPMAWASGRQSGFRASSACRRAMTPPCVCSSGARGTAAARHPIGYSGSMIGLGPRGSASAPSSSTWIPAKWSMQVVEDEGLLRIPRGPQGCAPHLLGGAQNRVMQKDRAVMSLAELEQRSPGSSATAFPTTCTCWRAMRSRLDRPPATARPRLRQAPGSAHAQAIRHRVRTLTGPPPDAHPIPARPGQPAHSLRSARRRHLASRRSRWRMAFDQRLGL